MFHFYLPAPVSDKETKKVSDRNKMYKMVVCSECVVLVQTQPLNFLHSIQTTLNHLEPRYQEILCYWTFTNFSV